MDDIRTSTTTTVHFIASFDHSLALFVAVVPIVSAWHV